MKIVLVIGGAIVAVILVVVCVGYALPQRHVASRQAIYHAKRERLFALIAGNQDWRPDVLRSEMVSEGGRQTMRETSRNDETISYELLDSKPPVLIKRRIATEHLPYSGTWRYSLEERDGGTVVRITEDGEVYNPIFRFVSRFILGHTKRSGHLSRSFGQGYREQIHTSD